MSGRRTGPGALERAGLLLQLVPYLLARDEVGVTEAARDFGVTPRRMRAMVETLTVVGRPGDDGLWPMPGDMFDIDWDLWEREDRIRLTQTAGLESAPRLTAREAAALLAGLQLIRTLPGVAADDVVSALLAKLGRGAAATPAELVVVPGDADAARRILVAGVRERRTVTFTYRAPDAAPRRRTVDPVRLSAADGQWYLQGWCHLRRGMRTFHLDRISDAELTDMPSQHGDEPVGRLFEVTGAESTVTVRLPSSSAVLLGAYADHADITESDGWVTAVIPVADPQGVRRLASRLGGRLVILDPPQARQAAVRWAVRALENYGQKDSDQTTG